MNQESHSFGELARPVSNTAGIVAGPPRDIARVVSASSSGTLEMGASTNFSTTSLLRALRRRHLHALGVAILLTSTVGPAAWYLVPPAKYKAQARLQLAAQPPKVLFRTVETDMVDDYKRYQTTQQTLVLSQLVLNTALQDKEVSTYRIIREQFDPIAWLKEKLKVEFIANSEVMEISLSGDYPAELAGLVNAVKKAYMEEVVNVDMKKRMDRHSQLKEYKKKQGEVLKERRDYVRRLAETVGTDDRQTLALKQQYAMEHEASLRRELLEVQSLIRRAEARNKIRPQPEESPDETSIPSFAEGDIEHLIDQDPSIARLAAQLMSEEERLSSLKANVGSISRTGTDPTVQRYRDKVAATKKTLKSQRASLRPLVIRQLAERARDEKLTKGDANEQDLAMLHELEQRLNAEMKGVQEGNQTVTVKTLDLQSSQDDIVQMQIAASTVASEVEALNLELSAPPRVRKIEDAVVPLHSGREKTEHDDRADHFRLVLRGPIRRCFPRIAQPKGRFRRGSPELPGASCRRHLADRAHQSQTRRMGHTPKRRE